MDLVSVSPIFNLYDKSWPLRTWQQQYPPAKFVFADPDRMGAALDSIVGGGSIISGGRVKRSVLGYDVRVNSYCEVENSIIFNHVNIGRHSRIRNAIIDRHVSSARAHRNRLRPRSRPPALSCHRKRHRDRRPRRIHARGTGIAVAPIVTVSVDAHALGYSATFSRTR